MSKIFTYKGREVKVISTLKDGGAKHGFGIVIDGEAINRGAYEGAPTVEQALRDGSLVAQQHIDSEMSAPE